MKVVFYTAVCFLDISLEIINVLKKVVDLHVIIELSEGSKTQNILDIKTLPIDTPLIHPSLVMTSESYKLIASYFEGTASVNFLVYPSKNPVKIGHTSVAVTKFIKKISPDVLHIEGTLVRSLAILPSFFYCKNLVMGIHDPVYHKGEKDWKMGLTRFLFKNFPVKKALLFYSNYAEKQYTAFYSPSSYPHYVVKMGPYTYFAQLAKSLPVEKNYILFFGRQSVYKGINVLIEAMEKVLNQLPNEKLVIAGKSYRDYKIDSGLLLKYPENIKVIDQHISNKDLVALITSAKFVICPYLEATQSGVLMTAFALDTPVIASDTGAFSEYIKDNVTGCLVSPGDPDKLAKAILRALDKNFYNVLSGNIKAMYKTQSWRKNEEVLLKAYHI